MIVLDSKQIQIIQEILNKYAGDTPVRVFGSRASGKPKPFSDIDLVMMTTQVAKASEIAQIKEAFSESDLTIKVDFLDWSDISPEFRKIIEAHSEPFPLA